MGLHRSLAVGGTALSIALVGVTAAAATREGQQAGPNLAAVRAEVARYKAIPGFVPPGPPVDARAARGKTVFTIPVSSTIPFVAAIDAGAKEAAGLAGVKYVSIPTNGTQGQLQDGFNQAIARKASAIILLAANPNTLAPQLRAAKNAGIPVVIGHEFPPGFPPTPNTVGQTLAPFYQAARLEAAYTILHAKGKANVLVITSNEQVAAKGMVNVIRSEFRKNCGAGCKLRVVNVPVAQWATNIQSEVQSALTRDPEMNYVIPLYDSMSQFAVPGVVAAGRDDQVKIVTFNGTPFVLKMIQDDDIVVADIGEDTRRLGWAIMDQVFRALNGVPTVADERTPLRVFDDSNVRQAGRPPVAGKGYGSAYISGYKRLWKLVP